LVTEAVINNEEERKRPSCIRRVERCVSIASDIASIHRRGASNAKLKQLTIFASSSQPNKSTAGVGGCVHDFPAYHKQQLAALRCYRTEFSFAFVMGVDMDVWDKHRRAEEQAQVCGRQAQVCRRTGTGVRKTSTGVRNKHPNNFKWNNKS